MTLQDWKKKYLPANAEKEDSALESSNVSGSGQKMTLAERMDLWMKKYVPDIRQENQTQGTKLSASGDPLRTQRNETPLLYDAPASAKKEEVALGYYSKPTLWDKADQYKKYVTISKAQMGAGKITADEAKAKMDSLYAEAERLCASFEAVPSESVYARWKEVCAEYETAVGIYNDALAGYNDAVERYNASVDSYGRYISAEQKKYDEWKGSIRTPEATSADRAAVQLSIDALEKEKNSLEKEKAMLGVWEDVGNIDLEELTARTREIEKIDAQLESLYKKRDLLDEENDWARYFQYEDMRGAADFAEKSKYVSTANGEGRAWADINGYAVTGYDDIKYELINKNKDAEAKQQISAVRTGASLAGTDMRELSQMTADEVAMFNYLYKKDSEEGDDRHARAYEYLAFIQGDLNFRQRQEESEYWTQYAKEHPVASSAFSVGIAPLKGLSALGQTAAYLATGKIDENATYNQFSHISGDIRDEVSGIVEEKWGKVGSFAYNTGMSMADFLSQTVIAGGSPTFAMVLMGSGTMADTVIEGKERGLTDGQAFALGVISGAIEAVTEKLSIDALLDKTTLGRSALGYFLKNAVAEGAEEGASNILNTVADVLVSRDKSEWQAAIDAYRAEGLSEKEALRKAIGDQAVSLGLDVLAGAISGGVLALPGVVTKGVQSATDAYYRKKTEDLPDRIVLEENTEYFEPEVAEDGTYYDLKGYRVLTDGTKEKGGNRVLWTADTREQGKRMKAAKTQTARTGIAVGATDGQIKTAERLSKLLGKEIRFFREGYTVDGSVTNGEYRKADDVILVNAASAKGVRWIVAHELTHSAELSLQYGDLNDFVLNRMKADGADIDALVEATMRRYEEHGAPLESEFEAKQEIVADYAADHLLTDERAIRELVRGRPTIGQKILRKIDAWLMKAGDEKAEERILLQKARDLYAKALTEADANRNAAAEQKTVNEHARKAADALAEDGDADYDPLWEEESLVGKSMLDGGAQFSIEKLPDGKKYVRADRQVIFGNDPRSWGEQLEDYINGKIRRGQDVQLIAEDGDVLTLTADTAGKGKHRYRADGKEMTLEEYETKINAETHIDELAKISTKIGAKSDEGNLHGEFASGGWDYRKAYFQDFDGKYYRLTLSVAIGEKGKVVYNVSNIRERDFPASPGSSRPKTGAQTEKSLSKDSISKANDSVKRKLSVSRTAEENEKILSRMRSILQNGGSAADLKQFVSDLEKKEGVDKTKTPSVRTDRRTDAAADIVSKAHAAEMSVEEYLRENAELYETEDGWNSDARRALRMESGARYSISPALKGDLQKVRDGKFNAKGNEVYIGESSTFLTDTLKTAALRVTMPSRKAYAAMVTEEEAKRDGRYDSSLNYHGLGVDGLYDVLVASEEPVAAFAGTEDEKGNSRDDYIVLVTEKAGAGGNLVAVMEVDTTGYLQGKRIAVNKTITSYDRPAIARDISEAARENRLLHLDKKRSQTLLAGVPGYNSPGAMQSVDFENSIRHFWENVKWKKSGAKTFSTEPPGEQKTGMVYAFEKAQKKAEMKKKLSVSAPEETFKKSQTKADTALRRTEKALLSRIGEIFSVPAVSQDKTIRDSIQNVVEEYMKTGAVSEETVSKAFEEVRAKSVKANEDFWNEHKAAAIYARNTAVVVDENVQEKFEDWNRFKVLADGVLKITHKDGIAVWELYEELRRIDAAAFPKNSGSPYLMLKTIYEFCRQVGRAGNAATLYDGKYQDAVLMCERHDFEVALNDAVSEMRIVRRYLEEQKAEEQSIPQTVEEVVGLYRDLKEARKAKDKAERLNLLTKRDEMQVGRLLRGELELDMLDPDVDNVDGITAVYEARQAYEKIAAPLRAWNKKRKGDLRSTADKFLNTANYWRDKKAGIMYSRETMERNIQDIVRDAEGNMDVALAATLIKEYLEPVHVAAAAANRTKNKYKEQVRTMKISRKVARGNLVSEAHAVQLLGEAEDNIDMLERSRGRIKERDGKTLEEWREIVSKLWMENPDLDEGKIRRYVQEFRDIYDELFQKMNEVRIRNGYEPINYRHGYFPHFQPGDGDGLLVQFGKAMGISMDVVVLPTSINGLTHTFRPGIQWFGNAQSRLGFNTAYDAVEGFDKYIEGVADVIHQTDNIQRLRALSEQIRYRTTDQGIREQIDDIRQNESLSEEDKQNRIEKLYEKGRYTLSNFVVELEEYTNLLANKKSRADRNMEQSMGRQMYSVVKALESRVAANMVAINPASWLTNFVPLAQGGATLDRGMLLLGMWDTLKSYKKDDGMVDRSSFLTNRRGSDPIVRTWAQSASAVASAPQAWIDYFTADSLVRARYMQNIRKGLSEDAAISEADAWTAGVMGDRSKGSMPTLFNRSNPITKVFTQFQLEVNNQFSYLFKDMPRDLRDKGLMALAAAMFKFFIGSWLFNELYEFVIGRRPAFDPIGILNDTVGDLFGYEMPNLVELGVGLVKGETPSFKVERKNGYEAVAGLVKSSAEELPFVGGILGGGRVPISSALPDWENLGKAMFNNEWDMKKRLAAGIKSVGNPLTYLVLPFGGGQLKKIFEGIKTVAENGSYTVDAQGKKRLQYPVYKDTPGEAILSTTGAVLFGKSSLPTGRDWVEGGFKTLSAKETACYQGMMESGVSGKEAYGLIQELRKAEKTDKKGELEVKRDILRRSSVSQIGKSIVYYGMLASDSERELMDGLPDYSDMGQATNILMDIQDVAKNADKLHAIAEYSCTDAEYKAYVGFVLDTEYTTDEGNPTKYANFVEMLSTGIDGAEAVRMLALGGDPSTYLEFTDAGVSARWAKTLTEAIAALEPEPGKKTVTAIQKYRAVIDELLPKTEELAALSQVMSESEYTKVQVGNAHGITPGVYVTFKELLPQYDADGNGSYSQAEVERAIESIGPKFGIVAPSYGPANAKNTNLTNAQRAVLWQLANKSWNPNSNPYSVFIGKTVYEELNG